MPTPLPGIFGRKDSARNLIFTILVKEYPLKTIELTNFIRKRYGRSITFQATRQAAIGLVEDGILERQGEKFAIRKQWVQESKQFLSELYETLQRPQVRPAEQAGASDDVRVYTFESVNALMLFWQELINDWERTLKNTNGIVNCYQTHHIWEAILHPDSEQRMMRRLAATGVTSYAVCTSDTPLDRAACRVYDRIGIITTIARSSNVFDKSYAVGTYGDLIIQIQYPERIAKRLDAFFRKNKTVDDLDLDELARIVNHPTPVKLTVIRSHAMAAQINKSIRAAFARTPKTSKKR